jgi:hypothetical protein
MSTAPNTPPSEAAADGAPPEPRYGESPYKGTDSFKVEDRDLFFGREREAVTLTSTILAARCSLLYARSGMGKTSLLNARVIPMLEAKGWTPVPVRLDDKPLDAIRLATFRWVVPPPVTEAQAIENARAALFGPGENPSLLDLVIAYNGLPVRQRERRTLVAPVALPERPRYLGYPASGDAVPFFTRFLGRSVDAPRFVEHINLIGSFADIPVPPIDPAKARVEEVLAILRDPAYEAGYAELLAELTGPVGDLAGFFRNVVSVWGQRHTQFGLVLLLDQFEELFTLFADSRLTAETPTGTQPRWEIRKRFLHELEGVYTSSWGEQGGALPLRLVIGMREEFIAQLDSVRRFVPELDQSSYHLSLLDQDSAHDAVVNPANKFGVVYEPQALTRILQGLAVEDEFVAPVTLQIVADTLWNELRRAERENRLRGALPPDPVITGASIDSVGGERGVLGILEGFFSRFLASLDGDGEAREALDILSQLITSGGTRNIVLRSELETVRYRVPGARPKVLKALVDAGIVRVERRLGSEFAEVMHEFLIGPILKHVRMTLGRDPEYHRLQGALRTLRRWEDRDRVGGNLLSREEIEEIRASAAALRLPPWAPELLLRSALTCGHQLEDFAALIEMSPSMFAQVQGGDPDVGDLVASIEERCAMRRWFGPENLSIIDRHRAALALTQAQLRFVWESTLRRARAGNEDDIRYWTQTLASHAEPPN